MSDLGNVVAQMSLAGLPPLPSGHPKLNGKYNRFGPGSRAWYILREMTLSSGRRVITGAFGIFQGENRNTVPVTVDSEEMSPAESTEYSRKLRDQEAKEANEKKRAAQLAANRGKDQWNQAANNPLVHRYLDRKQITAEGVRVSDGGLLLIPVTRDGQIVGLQKIDQDGGKKFNTGLDKIGGASILGTLTGAPVIGVGEGYATCRTVRMHLPSLAKDLPVAVAFDAGNIMHVARRLRHLHPAAHLLFLADDDYLLEQRYVERLRSEFKVFVPVAIDSAEHVVRADDGESVSILARWRDDAYGIAYIHVDVAKGRRSSTVTFTNAGVASCRAAASAVGNSSVAIPVFVDRAGRKLSDWNDLYAEEGGSVVEAQIARAVDAAQQPGPALPVVPAAPAATTIALAAVDAAAEVVAPLTPAAEQPNFAFPAPLAAPAAFLDLGVLFAEGVVDDSPPPPVAEQPACRIADGAERGGSGDASGLPLTTSFEAKFNAGGDIGPPHDAGDATAQGAGGDSQQAKEKPKKVYGADHWNQVEYVLKNFVLVYGEDLVWDVSQRMLMKISSMRTIVANSDVMKFWGGEARRWVLKKNIVFDPQDRPSPASSGTTATVNLFSGWKMTPTRGSCLRIQTLIAHLCDGNDALVEWVERWLAYPLRHRGAKMETSIIMHGDEGSGKNFFFEKVIKKIYGEYGYVIGNAQLESQFNDWASMKLFMVADEVVTRSELKHMKGKLKYLVSGDMIIINPKGLPEHGEANHMNFVFLSNELQPLALDKTDRRYLVIWTPPALSREFYVEVAQEIENGGIEAYYHYLMHELDMGDFDEHTKPIYTDAKDDLIEKSLTPAERFYRDWSRGFLPLPFISCGATQLYDAYKVWCDKSGESKYISQTIFSPTVLRYAGDALEKHLIKYELGSVVKQRNVFLVGKKPEGETLAEWATGASALFEKSLRAYRSRSMVDGADVEG